MFDIVAPLFWRIRERQRTKRPNASRVLLHIPHAPQETTRNADVLNYLSSFPLHTNKDLPSTGLHVREAVLGAYGMAVHVNEHSHWVQARYSPSPPFSVNTIAANLRALRVHLFKTFQLTEHAAQPHGLIVLANPPAPPGGRSIPRLENADDVLAVINIRKTY